MKVLILTMLLMALSYAQFTEPDFYTREEVTEVGNGVVIVETRMNFGILDSIFVDTISDVSMLHWLYGEYQVNDYFYYGKISGFGRKIDSLVAQEEMMYGCPGDDVARIIAEGETYVHVTDTVKIEIIKDYKGNIAASSIFHTSEFFGKCNVTEDYDGRYARGLGGENMLNQEFIEYGDEAILPQPSGCNIPSGGCWDRVGFFVDSLGMITKSGLEIPIKRNKWADWPIIELSLSRLELTVDTGVLPPIPTVQVFPSSYQPLQRRPSKILGNYNVKGQSAEAGSKYLRFLK